MATVGLRVIGGNSNRGLAEKICDHLGISLCRARIDRFNDGETLVEVGENVRGTDAFVIQSLAHPVNDHLMELLAIIDALKRASAKRITAVMPYYGYARQDRKNKPRVPIIDALKRASAKRITAVIPYYGYARQDRKSKPRVPITARLVADLLTKVGTSRVLTMDLHAGQIQGFFNIPVDNLYASPILLPHIREQFRNELVIVAPDAGGVPRARAYASRLNAGLALIDKRRADANQAEAMHLIGEVEDKTAVILDDMVDTAGTLVEAARTLLENGARAVHACCTHAILSGPAAERLAQSSFGSVVVTDTLPKQPGRADIPNLRVLSSALLFAEAIKSIHNEDSISRLFEIQH